MSATNVEIVPLAPESFEEIWHVFNAVASERRYLATTQALPFDQVEPFYRHVVESKLIYLVAKLDGRAVGWCDVRPTFGQARAHVGLLGMGLLPEARHRGIGRLLITRAIDVSRKRGLGRIELSVRSDNANAMALYKSVGFEEDGLLRKAFLIDGEYFDLHTMGLLL